MSTRGSKTKISCRAQCLWWLLNLQRNWSKAASLYCSLDSVAFTLENNHSRTLLLPIDFLPETILLLIVGQCPCLWWYPFPKSVKQAALERPIAKALMVPFHTQLVLPPASPDLFPCPTQFPCMDCKLLLHFSIPAQGMTTLMLLPWHEVGLTCEQICKWVISLLASFVPLFSINSF